MCVFPDLMLGSLFEGVGGADGPLSRSDLEVWEVGVFSSQQEES